MSTSELSGGARIHYIFQSIFVKSLEVYNAVFTYDINSTVKILPTLMSCLK
jgi:hypothetical protein